MEKERIIYDLDGLPETLETVIGESDETQNPPKKEDIARARSSLRMQYEAEVAVLKKKLGDLEHIRETLGLSRRKMCRLLFVDPSAWSRWSKTGEAPPHIYRALQWYLALNDKYPALDVGFWLQTVPAKTAVAEDRWKQELAQVRAEVRRYQRYLMVFGFIFGSILGMTLFWLAARPTL